MHWAIGGIGWRRRRRSVVMVVVVVVVMYFDVVVWLWKFLAVFITF